MKKIIIAHTAVGIVCITILGSIYLLTGHNSVGFAAMVAVISGMTGYIIPSPLMKKSN